eukprot:Sdes_comp15923_c0_seq1m5056
MKLTKATHQIESLENELREKNAIILTLKKQVPSGIPKLSTPIHPPSENAENFEQAKNQILTLKTKLDILRQERDSLKNTLQGTILAKDQEISMYHELLRDTKVEFDNCCREMRSKLTPL